MKKSILSVFCFIALNAAAQMEVVDVETMTTYNTRIIDYRGCPAIELDESDIIPTSQDAHDAVRANSFGKWKLYTGPAERYPIGPYGAGGQSMKVCLNTNNFPCMIARYSEAVYY